MMQLKPFQAAIFDMDGTILDTELVFRSIVFEVAGQLGYEMTDTVHKSMVGSSHETTNRLLVEAYGVAFPYAIFDEKCRFMMRERMHEDVPVKAGAREILAELRGRGIPTAIATSSRNAHATAHLGAAQLIGMFDTIVTRDDVANPKPHPEPYLLAAGRLGVEPVHCLALEDSHSGVRAASAAGMQTIMIPDLVGPNDEIRALCFAVMESLHQVREAAFPVVELTR
ncbi:haloacid dehalogenase [Devosia sp. H5989]|jgi:HAD superfamily hydrolase (TIGR01509 family)|uniref:HAD family phosphatase n=1 Tax=Paradevosia tibetensis TaxID=1447062 RepID=A0A5B9DJX2_9HYPH|nr:HAD family phosphatase [Youhaiella tibetensis]AKR58120.1 haloacid dehalogenase [Devosia sp. H5989]QEE18989.1 HAD family phosphatase [Youhaiella tibetensis]